MPNVLLRHPNSVPGRLRAMRRLGLLGGMSWESSLEYERIINEAVRDRLGGVASADLVIRSFNFADIEVLQSENRWEEAGAVLAGAASDLVNAGCDAIVMCTNTMHQVADVIQAAVPVPLLHIADATGRAVVQAGVPTVALLGTRYTMEKPFLIDRLREQYGLQVMVPDEADRALVHEVIYTELVRGVIRDESRDAYLAVVSRLLTRGAAGVIAGCTEIELLITSQDLSVPLFPTARLHALAAVDFALADQ